MKRIVLAVTSIAAIFLVLGGILFFLENQELKLLKAIQIKDNLAVKKILSKPNGLDLEKKFGGDDRTLLHVAIENRDYFAAIELLKLGANSNSKNLVNETPLYIATYLSDIKLINLLLEYDADVNFRETRLGTYPLYLAVRNKNIEIVKILVSHGATPCFKISDGSTAMEMGLRNNDEISGFLKKNGPQCVAK